MLVNAAELAVHLNDPTWVTFDCRHDLMDHGKGKRLYREGHLPGAHFAPVETALSGAKNGKNGRHPLPTPESFGAFLARHGVTPETTVVAYDDVGGQYAARLWWMARWIGLTHVALLDGGWSKWLSESRPTSVEVPVPVPVSPWLVRADHSLVWSAEDVLRQSSDTAFGIIDARTAERYRGEVEPIDPVAGHIPGARNLPSVRLLTADGRFRNDAELAALAGEAGAGASTAVYCGSGVTASVVLAALSAVGIDAALFPGSWSQWSAQDRPAATG